MKSSLLRSDNCRKRVIYVIPVLLLFLGVYCFMIDKTVYHEEIHQAKILNNDHKFSECKISRLEGPLMGDDPFVIANLRKNYLNPPSTLPYNFYEDNERTRNTRNFLEGTIYHKFVTTFFRNKRNGFFVEVGALDGESVSNTLWLEVTQNWTGLLIEPYSVNCESINEKHRKAWTSCSCITPKPYAETTVLEIPKKINYKPSNETVYRGIPRSMNSRFHTLNDMIQRTSSFSYSTVQCFPLISYLLALNVTAVDVLSLKTHGGERTVLANFPYDKIKVKYIFVEYYQKGANHKALDKDFEKEMALKKFNLVAMSEAYGDYIFMNRQ